MSDVAWAAPWIVVGAAGCIVWPWAAGRLAAADGPVRAARLLAPLLAITVASALAAWAWPRGGALMVAVWAGLALAALWIVAAHGSWVAMAAVARLRPSPGMRTVLLLAALVAGTLPAMLAPDPPSNEPTWSPEQRESVDAYHGNAAVAAWVAALPVAAALLEAVVRARRAA